MPHRIEVALKAQFRDAQGEKIRRRMAQDLGLTAEEVRTISVYTIDKEMAADDLLACAAGPFSDPIIQEFGIDEPLAREFDWVIEVGLLPGVTDNVGRTAREAVEQRTGRRFEAGEGVYTSTQYVIKGALSAKDAERVASGLLGNPLIQSFQIVPRSQWEPVKGVGVHVPKVMSARAPRVETIDLEVSDEDLMAISRDRVLVLSLEEMKAVRDRYRDPAFQAARLRAGLPEKPTDVELETLAQTWSEHCKHKIFTALIRYEDKATGEVSQIDSLFDTYIKASTAEIRKRMGADDWCLSVFKDNAGVIRLDKDWSLAVKVETHNSPSALDPYGGALTGIVGVNRDPFGTGMGSRLIFNVDTFCFATPFWDRPVPPKLLHPRRILEGVREGVEHGGNKSGIPTVNGGLVFDDRYAGKPLVFCGTGGIMPALVNGKPSHEKAAKAGDRVMMVGGRIGKDGIHGATFSSEHLHEGSPATAVQIGDPITQKRMTDFLLVARDRGLYDCITDDGAGGLSSSVGEMARDCGGADLELGRAPLKYPGLDPWEILLSEAQERMTLSVPPEKAEEFLALAKKYDVDATDLGQYTDSGYFQVRYDGKTAGMLDLDFMHEGCPRMSLEAVWERPVHPEPDFPEPSDLAPWLHRMLGSLNVCSREYVIRQYDHEVQGGSVIKPLMGAACGGPTDAAVLRPALESMMGLVVSNGICPKYSDIDAYAMMACAIDEAVRNNVAVGGDPDRMAGLDNFCWCDPVQSERTPDGRYKLAQLVRANRALYDLTTAYGVPCISGKDSMKNDFRAGEVKISIPPTVLFTAVSVIPDVRKACSSDLKAPGDLVFVLGKTRDETGGSEYFRERGAVGNNVPQVDAIRAQKLYRALHSAINAGLVRSCHDISDGGLGCALAESAFGGGMGLDVDLGLIPYEGSGRLDYLLFSESASRFVVTIREKDAAAFEEKLKGCDYGAAGKVRADGLFRLTASGRTIVETDIRDLKESWRKTLNF